MGLPPNNHPFLDISRWIFYEINHPAIGVPPLQEPTIYNKEMFYLYRYVQICKYIYSRCLYTILIYVYTVNVSIYSYVQKYCIYIIVYELCIMFMYYIYVSYIYIHIYTYFHMQYSHGSTITIDDRWRADMSANKQQGM